MSVLPGTCLMDGRAGSSMVEEGGPASSSLFSVSTYMKGMRLKGEAVALNAAWRRSAAVFLYQAGGARVNIFCCGEMWPVSAA